MQLLKIMPTALTSVAHLVRMSSHRLKVCGFDSWSGHILGCRFDPQWEQVYEGN